MPSSAKSIGAEVLFNILGHLYVEGKAEAPKQSIVGLHL